MHAKQIGTQQGKAFCFALAFHNPCVLHSVLCHRTRSCCVTDVIDQLRLYFLVGKNVVGCVTEVRLHLAQPLVQV